MYSTVSYGGKVNIMNEDIQESIRFLVYECAHDEFEEPIYWRKTETSLDFSCLGFNKNESEENILKQSELRNMVQKQVENCLKEFGYVYVYICKDNRIVSIEWPDSHEEKELESWKDHLKGVHEVIPDLYYEGWD